jgi:hypothetical protein
MTRDDEYGFNEHGAREPMDVLTPERRLELLQENRDRLMKEGLSDSEVLYLFVHVRNLRNIR